MPPSTPSRATQQSLRTMIGKHVKEAQTDAASRLIEIASQTCDHLWETPSLKHFDYYVNPLCDSVMTHFEKRRIEQRTPTQASIFSTYATPEEVKEVAGVFHGEVECFYGAKESRGRTLTRSRPVRDPSKRIQGLQKMSDEVDQFLEAGVSLA